MIISFGFGWCSAVVVEEEKSRTPSHFRGNPDFLWNKSSKPTIDNDKRGL
jgi:hypothetical protein